MTILQMPRPEEVTRAELAVVSAERGKLKARKQLLVEQQTAAGGAVSRQVSENDEFCIKNDEICE